MYSRGNNAYEQQQSKPQPYSAQFAFGQNPGPGGVSRHSALLGSHPSAGAHYGGQYTSVYGSSAHNSALQVPASKGAGSSVLEGRSGYDSPKYTSDYPSARLSYAERASAYSGRDLPNDPPVRFADSIAFGHQHKPDIYDRLDAATTLRQELLQSASVDGSSRQADYLAARSATVRSGQDLLSYGGRFDTDLHGLSMTPSIIGVVPRREVEDLMYARGSANPRLSYAERASAYSGRDLPNDPPVRFADSIAFGHQHKVRQERYETVTQLITCRMAEGSSVSSHVIKMKGYIDRLEKLDYAIPVEMATDLILHSLSSSFNQFRINFNTHNWTKTVSELHDMLKTAETNIVAKTPGMLMIRSTGVKKTGTKKKKFGNKGKGKAVVVSKNASTNTRGKTASKPPPPPEERQCFECNKMGHWRRNCPDYLANLKNKKNEEGSS